MATCAHCWIDEWFDLDDAVGSARSGLDIMSSGKQILDCEPYVRRLKLALSARQAHYAKLPAATCTHGIATGVEVS